MLSKQRTRLQPQHLMTISSAWLRVNPTLVGSRYACKIREPRLLLSCRRLCTSPLPRGLHAHAQCTSIDQTQKSATSLRLVDRKFRAIRFLQCRLIASCNQRPRLSDNRHRHYALASKGGTRVAAHRTRLHATRLLFTSTLGTILTPPAVFLGLAVVLWIYKCCMMVIFQNKIIYMPSVPPFSRQEEIVTYADETKPVVWKQENIASLDGTRIALCVGTLASTSPAPAAAAAAAAANPPKDIRKHLYVIYFHGNASSLPPRLPMLTAVLRTICSEAAPVSCTIIALSYRGFWKSSGRASQPGIEKDAAATIKWVQKARAHDNVSTACVLWGQSIGAGVAMRAMANLLSENPSSARQVDGLILETPFVSIKSMLQELYPQKWLPYRYLWPFLRSWWDNAAALHQINAANGPRDLLILTAAKDEVVPVDHGEQISDLSSSLGFAVQYETISGAYHHEVMSRREGRYALSKFVADILKNQKR